MTAPNPILRLEACSKHFGGLSVIEDLSFVGPAAARVRR